MYNICYFMTYFKKQSSFLINYIFFTLQNGNYKLCTAQEDALNNLGMKDLFCIFPNMA